jgi:AcrR family transcriptional regulator
MARIVNEAEYNQKRNEILNTAKKLVYTIGFEQMTIQDILNELNMSKGAFYHYFDSKADLLEALIKHISYEIITILDPIIEDPNLSGLEKLNTYFSKAATWKTNQKAFFISIMKSWYTDGNAIVRSKINRETTRLMTPIINRMVNQAIQEGECNTEFPEHAGDMIFTMFLGLGETLVENLLSPEPKINYRELFLAYTTAIELILGVEKGRLVFMDPEILDEWHEFQRLPNNNL